MILSCSLDVRQVLHHILFFNFIFSYLNFIIYDFSRIVVNPDSGTEFIPNSDRLPEKKMPIWDLHSIILNDKI
jgi:hypothetical protein